MQMFTVPDVPVLSALKHLVIVHLLPETVNPGGPGAGLVLSRFGRGAEDGVRGCRWAGRGQRVADCRLPVAVIFSISVALFEDTRSTETLGTVLPFQERRPFCPCF